MKNGLVIAALVLAACSSTPAANKTDAGGGDSASEASANTFTLSGRIVDFGGSNPPTKGATVTAGTSTATTDDKGMYSLTVPKNTAFSLNVQKTGYVKLIEQETMLTGDADRGDTDAVGAGTQSFLEAALTGFNGDLAVFSLQVIARGSCASADGATVALDPVGTEKLLYFKSGFPNSAQMSVIDGTVPSAVFYNVTVGQKITVKVTHPTCKQSTFPIADVKAPNITYSGAVNTEPGDPVGQKKPAASFARIYIE